MTFFALHREKARELLWEWVTDFYKHCCCCCCCCCNWRFPVRRWKWITEVPVVFNLPWIISTLSLRLQSSGHTEENGGKQNNFLSCVFHTFAYVTIRYQDFRCQFHQHYTHVFFVRMSFRQLFSSYMYVEKRHSYEKLINVDEIDARFHTIQSFFCGINWTVIQLISDAKFSGPCLLHNK